MDNLVKKLPAIAILLILSIVLLPLTSAYAFSAAVGSVRSAVTIAGTNDPLVGVTIKVLDMKTAETVAEARTTDKGVAEIGDLPLGLYQVTVVAPEGYASTAGPLVFFDEENTSATLNFVLEPLPNAPAAAFVGRFPIWALLALIGAGVGVAAAVIVATGTP